MSFAIDVVIPFFSNVDYLRDAIESVRAQRDDRWRLWIADDSLEAAGEAGPARGLVEDLGDPRIHYHRNERNLGMVPNWNAAMERAPGDRVTLLHGDDRLLPGYVELMAGLSERHPDAAAHFCGAEIIDAEGRPAFSLADRIKDFFVPRGGGDVVLSGESAVRTLLAGNFVMCPTLCLRKSILGTRRFDPEWKQAQDLELTTRLLFDGDVLAGTRAPGYAYRRHAESATEKQSESLLRFEEEFALYARVAARAEAMGWRRAARTARRATMIKLHLSYRILRDLAFGRGSAARTKAAYLLAGPRRERA